MTAAVVDTLPDEMTTSDANEASYTIDELAAVSKVPSRTIRFYQSKGALKGPEIRGRVAYYGPAHLERLKLIAQLQDRGLRIDAIRDLVVRIDRGELDVNEWLGLEQQLQAPWANDQPRTATEAELYDLAGSRRAGLIGDLVRTDLVRRHGDVYFVRSPALLSVAMRLEASGIDLETAREAAGLLRKHMARAATDLVDLFFKRAAELGREEHGADLGAIFEALRPMGMEAIRVVFGQEMERVLRKMVESGKMAELQRRTRSRGKPERGRK
jgi:DNA-binding transcriptional MerR regulator